MDDHIRRGAFAGICTIILSVPVVIFDYTDIGEKFSSSGISYWVLFVIFFIPYVLYGLTYALYAYGLATLGKKCNVDILKIAFYTLAGAFVANTLLGLPGLNLLGPIVAPGPTTSIVRGVLLCISSVALLKLYPVFGRLIVWTSIAGIVAGVTMLFNVGDFPSIAFLASGSIVLLRGISYPHSCTEL